jgi:uncharacterized protein
MQDKPQITCFLIKIASRCNLACDYCYMYNHADQSWKKQPYVMSEKHRKLLAFRINEYVEAQRIKEIVVVFHGGEPLLAGVETIIESAKWIRESTPSWCKVGFSIQTNGLLLNRSVLDRLEKFDIGVSLSIDGHKDAHDLHRLDHKGNSSFNVVEKALQLLKNYPRVYSGLIAVIDPLVQPKELFEFFNIYQPPQLDFLLPDANHDRLPLGRCNSPDLYASWLVEAFDVWFDHYAHIPVRTFDTILSSLAGLPSTTDSFGFGDVSLLTIETDGSYHDLDVLKITSSGISSLGAILEEDNISDTVEKSSQIQQHRKLLTYEGLSLQCQDCSVVDICGGGSVPHRYAKDGFTHPTVYCHEMLTLINHVKGRLQNQLYFEIDKKIAFDSDQDISFDEIEFEQPETSTLAIQFILKDWLNNANKDLESALKWSLEKDFRQLEIIGRLQASIKNGSNISIYPSVIMWVSIVKRAELGITAHTIDGDLIRADSQYPQKILELLEILSTGGMQPHLVHRDDKFLRMPFGKNILFEDEENMRQAENILKLSLGIIRSWRPALSEEIRLISPEIQFIHDLTAHPEKIVSFSDNSVPGALYVSIKHDGHFIDAYDLADSLIHEHRHQKLYLFQRLFPLLIHDTPLVSSPWREDLRPPSGLFHAVFVFTHLLEFWVHLSKQDIIMNQDKAHRQVEIIKLQLFQGFEVLKGTALTNVGFRLLNSLELRFKSVI